MRNRNRLKTFFQRKKGKPTVGVSLTEVNSNTKQVHDDLRVSLAERQVEGVVDLKVTCGSSSSVNDKLWVLNNVLRLKREGKFTSTDVR